MHKIKLKHAESLHFSAFRLEISFIFSHLTAPTVCQHILLVHICLVHKSNMLKKNSMTGVGHSTTGPGHFALVQNDLGIIIH